MANRSQEFRDQKADQQAKPSHVAQDRAPVEQRESPADSAQRAMSAPGTLAPRQALALQRAVGNRAVQRHLNRDKKNLVLQDAELARDAAFEKDFLTATLWLGMGAQALAEGSEISEGGPPGPEGGTEAG
jgi:hypothetical protein